MFLSAVPSCPNVSLGLQELGELQAGGTASGSCCGIRVLLLLPERERKWACFSILDIYSCEDPREQQLGRVMP